MHGRLRSASRRILSLLPEKYGRRRRPKTRLPADMGCLILSNFGTYLGRYLRFNSWDAITRPGQVLAGAGRYVIGGRRVAEAVGYTLAFGSFTLCVYLVVALPVLP